MSEPAAPTARATPSTPAGDSAPVGDSEALVRRYLAREARGGFDGNSGEAPGTRDGGGAARAGADPAQRPAAPVSGTV